jgi:hypothetical protein
MILATAAAISGTIAHCTASIALRSWRHRGYPFPEFAHGHALNWLKPLLRRRIPGEAADFIFGRIDQRLLDDFSEGKFGEPAFRGHAFALRSRRDPAN